MKILIVDDHTLFREGLRLLLGRLSADAVVCEVGSIEAALAPGAVDTDVDLILLDLKLPGLNGLDGLGVLRGGFPDATIVLLSGSDDPRVVNDGLARGARGFIPKSASADCMLDTLRRILAGEICVPDLRIGGDAASPVRASIHLTPRQIDVLTHLCEGVSNKEIGRLLAMSENTVRSHVAGIFQALGVRTRTEAAAVARRAGIA